MGIWLRLPLKSLLPEFEGQVKCIYIDPPYNTGNEGWAYNDAVNDPKMKRWLGQVVGKEGEDLSRHDKWLCMMYPRLKLLHRLLARDGIIFISIDENEVHNLRLVADEIFGANRFVASITAITNLKGRNDKRHVSGCHEYILIYANPDFKSFGLPLTDEQRKAFRYEDDSGQKYALRDMRKRGGPDKREDRPNMFFPLYWNVANNRFSLDVTSHDDIKVIPLRGDGSEGRWRWGIEKVATHLPWIHIKKSRSGVWGAEHRVYLDPTIRLNNVTIDDEDDDEDGDATSPEIDDDSEEESDAVERVSKPKSFWLGGEFSSDRGKRVFKEVLPGNRFEYPKSVDLIKQCLRMGCPKDGLILDSFAGSGTTAHACFALNAEDGGKRRFILIEMNDYVESTTIVRAQRVTSGYQTKKALIPGTGGGFDYFRIGESIFQPGDNLNEAVGVEAIRGYVAYSEGIPSSDRAAIENPHSPYLLGLNRETAWFFHYESNRATSLDMEFLAGLRFGGGTGAKKPGTVIVYADRCLLSQDFMTKHGIIFKKIPRDITRF
jgi:adenine-specific DNA-methyltransferase